MSEPLEQKIDFPRDAAPAPRFPDPGEAALAGSLAARPDFTIRTDTTTRATPYAKP